MSKKKKNIKKRRTNFRYNENDERTIGEDILSFVSTFLVVSILIILVSAFLFKPALIQGRSMYPNFQNGDRGVSNVIGVSVEGIQRGDIVLAKTTTEKGEPTTVIKRVIGLPGETVECKEEQVYIDGKPLDESEYLDNDYAKEWKETNGFLKEELGKELPVFDPVPLLSPDGGNTGRALYGGHPNAEGCRKWAQALSGELIKWLA